MATTRRSFRCSPAGPSLAHGHSTNQKKRRSLSTRCRRVSYTASSSSGHTTGGGVGGGSGGRASVTSLGTTSSTSFLADASKHRHSAAGSAALMFTSKAAPNMGEIGIKGGCKNKIEEFKKAFCFFDSNNDGYITSAELEAAMNKCGQFPSKLELRLIMYHGDHDKNGVITFDEFTHLMDGSTRMNKYTYDQLKEQFRMFDKDCDGYIEKPEMVKCVQELCLTQSFPLHIIEQLFREADVDGDGRISFEEFVLAVN